MKPLFMQRVWQKFSEAGRNHRRSFRAFYDTHWKDCSKEASAYKLILRQEDEANLRKARISVIRQVSGETIYSMDVYKHPRLEAAYE